MQCPHCLVEYHANPSKNFIGEDKEGGWSISNEYCPNPKCQRLIIVAGTGDMSGPETMRRLANVRNWFYISPYGGSTRQPCPPEVPDDLRGDYNEACLVMNLSPKASAALSRRCLQHLLRKYAAVEANPPTLYQEIEEVIKNGGLSSGITDLLHTLREIGNLAAHPKESPAGEIINVEPHEAELSLTVLESLFDFYFVLPAKNKARKAEFDAKLSKSKAPKQ